METGGEKQPERKTEYASNADLWQIKIVHMPKRKKKLPLL
jgi:hypothetical protein